MVPIAEAADALGLELLEQPLADRPLHGLVVGLFVLEQPGQIERLEFLDAERRKFRGRRRKHLHRAELQRLDFFLVLEQLRVRVDLDLDLAVGVLLGEFLEFERALALRRVVGDDVAEFDDDRPLGHGGARSDENGGSNPRQNQLAHELSSQLARKPAFFGFPVFSSGSKPLSEQLDLSRIGEAWRQARMMVV